MRIKPIDYKAKSKETFQVVENDIVLFKGTYKECLEYTKNATKTL